MIRTPRTVGLVLLAMFMVACTGPAGTTQTLALQEDSLSGSLYLSGGATATLSISHPTGGPGQTIDNATLDAAWNTALGSSYGYAPQATLGFADQDNRSWLYTLGLERPTYRADTDTLSFPVSVLSSTEVTGTPTEISQKIGQADVPDILLSLLSALNAGNGTPPP